MRNLASFKTSLNFEPPAFENAARYPNSETKMQRCDDRPMPWTSLVKLGPRTPEKALSVLPTPKIARENVIVNISAVDYSISLKFSTEFQCMTPVMYIRSDCEQVVLIISSPSRTCVRYTGQRAVKLCSWGGGQRWVCLHTSWRSVLRFTAKISCVRTPTCDSGFWNSIDDHY